ncbi:MAG TPA: pirin family protein [Pseudomonadota bacterium]|nr:pirin family protein [Pseudomonadota bacterium]
MSAILSVRPLGFTWDTVDPFLFCVHHNDDYPQANEQMGPTASLAGRDIGQDFAGKDGFRMYHGDVVPGFPNHPHRGFETVTIVRRGFVDHSDSLGATARYGRGDVQWLTAGKGIQHAEMFPLLDRNARNPIDLFQIWLNLPRADKMVDPHFSMLWANHIPHVIAPGVDVLVVAGALASQKPLPPPPHSYASRKESEVAIWTIKLAPGAKWSIPAASAGVRRTVYFYSGPSLSLCGHPITARHLVEIRADVEAPIQNGEAESELLILQGRPLGEPVVQHGPFVMNSQADIRQAFADYQRTQFGGWPWKRRDPVHPRDAGRFAKHVDGRIEKADS